jgi:phosphoribosylglycinamide formyltransferase-1
MILISGRGSNMQNLVAKAEDFTVCEVLSNRADAAGLVFAGEHGIPVSVFDRSGYGSLRAQKQAIYNRVYEVKPDLIALAGFMLILEAEFTDRVFGRLINVHPSLLPAYPGIDTHERVLAAGELRHGCTVHFVDSGVDTGPVIAQAGLDCRQGESATELAARVLHLEHRVYPWCVNAVARGDIFLEGRRVGFSPEAQTTAQEAEFFLPQQ